MTIKIYPINKSFYRKKVASFDYDWTLVKPKNNKQFPSNIDDWCWLYDNVSDKLKQYYNNGFMIVIFTNQSKKWKILQIKKALKTLEIPITIVVATEKDKYKPNRLMFDELFKDYPIKIKKSFFVGDALGRKNDFSDSDKQFSKNIGLKCLSPEEFFCDKQINFKLPNISLNNKQEIIIMVGYPGSGKSTISKKICENNNYIHIEGDIYKVTKKMINASIPFIQDNKSIIFDATNYTKLRRNEYVELAKQYNLYVRCFHIITSFENSFNRNKLRNDNKQVPLIAYNTYKKRFENPDENEGFELLEINLD